MSSIRELKQIVEAALLAAGRPLSLDQLQGLFDTQGGVSVAGGGEPGAADEGGGPDKQQLREVLGELTEEYAGRGIEIAEVGSGFRIQVRSQYASWVSRLYAERPPKYSRALLETLALIAYRQPITRGEIEDIRGVSVSTNIVKTLTEREWVRVVGHRDVPGKPALYATTKEFLDYFNLKGLGELPSLAEIRDLESINRELELQDPDLQGSDSQTAEQQTNIEVDRMQDDDLEDLIETDPDGETDSGVVHQAPESGEKETVARPDNAIDFDPDGETDSMTDLPEELARRQDETD
ncbi:MAG: SMC-Scp complex subunit ScpB [Pseudomonadota bacterium]